MPRKLFRTGNSVVVSLPKYELGLLGMEVGSHVTVSLDREHGQLVIAPAEESAGVDEQFSRHVAEFVDRYRPALRALAER